MHKLSPVAESGGLLFVVVRRLIVVASFVVEHGPWGTGFSVVMVCGFSCPAAGGILVP